MRILAAIAGRMERAERVLIGWAGILMLLACILPLWHVNLRSPQYPEGLKLVIHSRHISGDIQNVNILNHYIGMRPISDEAFPEFNWMMPVIAAIGTSLIVVSLVGRREVAVVGRVMLFGFDAYMLWDLSYWMHDWGHQLDPRAAIHVEPFTPPLMGFKQIANFMVLSYPSWGGLCMIAASCIGGYTLWSVARKSS